MTTATRPSADELLIDALVANTIAAARAVRARRPFTAFLRPAAVERHDRMRGVVEGLAVAIAVTLDLDHFLVLDLVNSHDAVAASATPTREVRDHLVQLLLTVAGRSASTPALEGVRS